MKNKLYDAVILAAGKSHRYNSSKPKQYLKINSKNLINIAIEKISETKKIKNIFVVIDKNSSYKAPLKYSNIFLVKGGATRTKSVFNALRFALKSNMQSKNIIIHDAARPCVDIKDINRLLDHEKSIRTGVSLGYPLTNALKKINKKSIVVSNIKRDNLYMSFTPQLFNFSKLFKAYSDIISKKIQVDDEIEAMSLLNYNVKIIKASVGNIKLTYEDDLKVIKLLMNKK